MLKLKKTVVQKKLNSESQLGCNPTDYIAQSLTFLFFFRNYIHACAATVIRICTAMETQGTWANV